jgi:UDP-3-O-[3-hydroxymyristoyl] glucosamine N-acyltransferase
MMIVLIGYHFLENGHVQIEDNMTIGGEATTNLGVQNEITNEGNSISIYLPYHVFFASQLNFASRA